MARRDRSPYQSRTYSPCPEPELLETSITIEHGPIAPGEKVVIESENTCWSYVPALKPTHFVYSGTKDLWLLQNGSDNNRRFLFPTDMHLDSFRAGAPSQVDWDVIRPNQLRFHVENRARGRNAQPGWFVARIVGFVAQGY